MLSQLSGIDTLVLVLLLLVMPAAGIIVALRKKNTETYFLAGRNIRWWTVAGSVFGTNISSFHLIGMLGIGYSIGFVQSHYEIVFPAILLLCYVFLASYRKLGLFTLSQYLEIRYNEYARLIYSILLVLIILVQLIGAFYVGSITLQWLFGGSSFAISYEMGLLLIGLITCSYTLWGGMESIVITDSIQTLMMLAAGLAVAFFTFSQPEIGGFLGLLDLDAAQPREVQKMHLYLPSNHPNLPWSGIFTGLLLQHCFNFSTNQFLVQRVLAASSDDDARKGIIASGFLKLMIPFFSIASGIAAYYLFKARFGDADFNSDNTFLRLVETVIPAGVGLTGMILAGLTAATFSSVDSMMNAATTLLTVDIYRKYIRPQASDAQTLRFGRLTILVMVLLAILVAWLTYTPDRSNNFFLRVSAQLSYFTPGIMVAFFFGILWRRADGRAAAWAMVLAPVYGFLAEWIYRTWLGQIPEIQAILDENLNFMHRVAITFVLSSATLVGLSLLRPGTEGSNPEGFERLRPELKARTFLSFAAIFIALQLVLILLMKATGLPARSFALWGALAAFGVFVPAIRKDKSRPVYQNDLLYAALLSAASVWVYYFFA
ncbi:MAG: sodium:solute symporter [Bacteroidetes bacterium]|nr:MAG: sodium:solute symporter [Bacteroidota bacterium]